jgi:hypothetical protein
MYRVLSMPFLMAFRIPVATSDNNGAPLVEQIWSLISDISRSEVSAHHLFEFLPTSPLHAKWEWPRECSLRIQDASSSALGNLS